MYNFFGMNYHVPGIVYGKKNVTLCIDKSMKNKKLP